MKTTRKYKVTKNKTDILNLINDDNKYCGVVKVLKGDKLEIASGRGSIVWDIKMEDDNTLSLSRETTFKEYVVTFIGLVLALLSIIACQSLIIGTITSFIIMLVIELASFYIYVEIPLKYVNKLMNKYSMGSMLTK